MEDILRSIALGGIVTTLILTMTVLYHYVKRQHLEKQLNSNLTWHVVTMLIVFLLISGYCSADVIARFGTPQTWRAFVLIPTFTLSNAGLYFMLKFQINRSSTKIIGDGKESTDEETKTL